MDIGHKILDWYNNNKRELPWRNTAAPYPIWVSEIILQQTRISQGMSYYHSFLEHFPSLQALAAAPEDDVLKVWKGLGYYSRARNLHETAKFIVSGLNGKFPNSFDELRKLKGIGDYTAAAIASISFGEAVPSVDGNVYRVLSRLFAVDLPWWTTKGKKYFFELAQSIIDTKKPGDFNQAMMELGALICTPGTPICHECPVANKCKALSINAIQHYPAKKEKKAARNRYFHYLVFTDGASVYFNKRTANDIWKNLYDFPLIEADKELDLKEVLAHPYFQGITTGTGLEITGYSNSFVHHLSHQTIYARFIQISIKSAHNFPANFKRIPKNNIFGQAIPKLIENYLSEEPHSFWHK